MSTLLYIEVSPRKERSASSAVAQSFISSFLDADTNNKVEVLDLWATALPEFNGDSLNAKYRVLYNENPSPDEVKAWQIVTQMADRFKAADHYLFSVPMWNFSIPYKLKHYIDIISQPGLTWSFSPESGYSGLVTAKSVTLALARGGEYSSSAEVGAMDYQRTYLEMILGFMGFKAINTLLVEPTLTAPEARAQTVSKVKKEAELLAKEISLAASLSVT